MTDPAAGPGPRERAYRHLLAFYPREHRSAHEEEMLGVLMTGARDGLTKPTLRESANLVSVALRIRLRTGLTDPADPRWRNTLSAVSVILPLILLAEAASSFLFGWLYEPQYVGFSLQGIGIPLAVEVQLILVILILLRLRRTAALCAAMMLIWWIWIAAGGWASAAPLAIFYLLFYGLEISALLASPGPRRGLQILTSRRLAILAAAGVTAGAVVAAARYPGAALPVTLAAAGTLAAISAGMILASPASRRILAVVAIPAASLTVALTAQRSLQPDPVWISLAYLVPVLAAALAALTVWHSRSHPVPRDSSGRHP